MKRLLVGTVVLTAALLLGGCERPQKYSERRVVMTVESVHLTSKTNSKVTLRENVSGMVHTGERLSCSRSKASNVKIGSKWDVTEVTYVYPEKQEYFSRLVGTSAICDKSN